MSAPSLSLKGVVMAASFSGEYCIMKSEGCCDGSYFFREYSIIKSEGWGDGKYFLW